LVDLNDKPVALDAQVQEAYRLYAARLDSHLLSIFRSNDEVADILQEPFLRYFLYLKKGKQVDALYSFLMRISTRLAMRRIGQIRHRKELLRLMPLPVEPRQAWRVEAWSAIKAIWPFLDPQAMMIAKLLLLDEMTLAEISRHTGWSHGVVQRRIKRIRALAREKSQISLLLEKDRSDVPLG